MGLGKGTEVRAETHLEAHLVQGGALDLGQLEGLQRLAAGAAVQVEADPRLAAPRPPAPLPLAGRRDPRRLRAPAGNESMGLRFLGSEPARSAAMGFSGFRIGASER